MFDRQRLPLTRAYFESLPEGLESHSQCQVVREAFEILLLPETEIGGLAAQGWIDPAFVDTMRALDGAAWVPETVFQCMALILVDLHGEQAYFDWSRNSASELYDKPFLRHLIRLLSPTLLVMGAKSRWGAVRRGSSLAGGKVHKDGDRVSTQVVLTHPPGVYADIFFDGLVQAFEVALESSRGKKVAVAMVGRTETSASYDLSWSR